MKIMVVLPYRENFSPLKFGAVAFTVKDNISFSKYKKDTFVYGATTENNKSFEGINYKKIELQKSLLMNKTNQYIKKLLKEIEVLKPDIIHVHNRPNIAYKLSSQSSSPVILFLHNDPQTMKLNYFERLSSFKTREKILNKLKAVISISKFCSSKMLEGVKSIYKKKVFTFQNCMDTKKYSIYKNSKKKNKFVFIGRMIEEKGVLEYVKAFNKISSKIPNWEALLITSPKDKNYEKKVQKEILKNSKIINLGFTPFENVMKILSTTSISVLPSYWEEPFGKTILESSLMKNLVITCRRGGIPEIIEDGGVYAKPKDIEDLSKLMLKYAKDKKLRDKKIKISYKKALRFDARITSKKIDDLTRSILNEKNK